MSLPTSRSSPASVASTSPLSGRGSGLSASANGPTTRRACSKNTGRTFRAGGTSGR